MVTWVFRGGSGLSERELEGADGVPGSVILDKGDGETGAGRVGDGIAEKEVNGLGLMGWLLRVVDGPSGGVVVVNGMGGGIAVLLGAGDSSGQGDFLWW